MKIMDGIVNAPAGGRMTAESPTSIPRNTAAEAQAITGGALRTAEPACPKTILLARVAANRYRVSRGTTPLAVLNKAIEPLEAIC
jgi:hypothetical protein